MSLKVSLRFTVFFAVGHVDSSFILVNRSIVFVSFVCPNAQYPFHPPSSGGPMHLPRVLQCFVRLSRWGFGVRWGWGVGGGLITNNVLVW